MLYDYIIVGMGPTGLTLGLNLLKTNKTVLFIEAEKEIGGCWKVDYTNEGYFVEHSPKVLSKTGTKQFNKLIKYLGVHPNYNDIYINSTFLNIVGTIFKQFLVTDIIKLGVYVFLYLISLNNKKISIKDWCISKNISIKAQGYLNIISIAISNTYDKLTLHAFINFMYRRYQYLFNLQQLYQPNEWLTACFDKLKKNKNVRFQMNTRVKRFTMSDDNTVSEVLTDYDEVHRAKEYICCVPIRALYAIMKGSFQPNWFSTFNRFKHFVDNSSYTGIGFQLHYTKFFKLPERWCWSCVGDWKVIVVDKTHLLKTKSYDKEIKQVLSCVIVDLDSKSKYIKKSVNECSKIDEIVKEATRQINERGEILYAPKRTTVSQTVYRSEFGWDSINSSFSYSMGKLPCKGKMTNLYSVGPHNMDEVVIIDTAIESAQRFTKNVLKIKSVF